MNRHDFYKQYIEYPHAMNVANNKNQAAEVFWTYEKVQVESAYPTKYKRNYRDKDGVLHLKGSERKKYYNTWIPKYKKITEAWKASADKLQTSAGLNHNIRNCIYVDYDDDIIKAFQTKKMPLEPSFVLRNPKTGHGQFIWLLKEGLSPVITRTFMEKFTALLDADKCATGWQMKNPYSKQVDLLHCNEELEYGLYDLYHIGVVSEQEVNDKIDCKINKKINAEKRTANKTAIHRNERKIVSKFDYSSRHCHFRELFRNLLWKEMALKGTKEFSTEFLNALAEKCDDKAMELANKSLPRRIDDINGYKADIKSVYSFAKREFGKFKIKGSGGYNSGGFFNDNARTIAACLKACEKILKYEKVIKSGGKSQKEISELTGLSKSTISRLLRTSPKEKVALWEKAQKLKKYVEYLEKSNRKDTYLTNAIFNAYNTLFKQPFESSLVDEVTNKPTIKNTKRNKESNSDFSSLYYYHNEVGMLDFEADFMRELYEKLGSKWDYGGT